METSNDGILDFVKILYSLGTIDENVGASAIGTETPDFSRFSYVVIVFLAKITGTSFEFVTWVDFAVIDVLGKTIRHGLSLHKQTIVLVGGFRETHDVRFLGDGFTVRNDGIGFLDRYTSVILLKIFQANFKMKFTSSGDNVLARFFDYTLDHRIGLGQTLKT